MVITGMKWRYHEMFAISNIYVEIEFVDNEGENKYLYMESGMEAYVINILKDSIIEQMYNYGSLSETERLTLDEYVNKNSIEAFEFMNDDIPSKLEKSEYIDIINFASNAIGDYPWDKEIDDEVSARDYLENNLNVDTHQIKLCQKSRF